MINPKCQRESVIIARMLFREEPKLEIHQGKEAYLKEPSFLRGKHLSKERYCIGYSVVGKLIPHGIPLTKGHQCEECKKRDAFFFCSMCDGRTCYNSRTFEEWCSQPFSVYLAYFGGKTVKVGVAAKRRLKERLWEQGAIAYRLVGEFEDGMKARRKESEMRKELPDKLTLSQKLKLYRELDLDWFESKYGVDGILKANLDASSALSSQILLREVNFIPDEDFKLLGNLLVFRRFLVNFKSLVGKKVVKRSVLSDFARS
ncbi:MAG TPA: DUF2797 domain-containing protein [Candidatus Aenigmarchaeota archaeon]|nr:DUF2797 domain-containing protein [Candidatus Aenigmarchaeota archaeon]